MLILALDSAGSGCGACVWRDGNVLALREEAMERGQDARLMMLVVEVMREAKINYEDLDRIAVTRGPGSFTGLRIGLAAARGIGLAAGKPVIGVDRFSVYAAQFEQGSGYSRLPEDDRSAKNLFVILNAKRKEFFCRFYPASGATHDPAMMTKEEIEKFLHENPHTLRVGDSGLPREQKATESEVVVCAALAALASPDDPAFLPRPLYLRAPDVTLRKITPQIFPCGPEHLDQLVALHAESFPDAAWSREQLAGSLALPTTRGWIAQDKNERLGFILFQATDTEAEILTFCVRPSARRRGIAGLLLNEGIAQIRPTRVFLDVAADNEAARGLYEKEGFHVIGTRPAYYRGRDAIMYEFFIVPAAKIS